MMQTVDPALNLMNDNYQNLDVQMASDYGMTNLIQPNMPHATANGMEHMQPDPRRRDMNELLQQLTYIPGQDIGEAQGPKYALRSHRLMPVLYDVLCEVKERASAGLSLRRPAADQDELEDKPNDQLTRLDNMLIAEGIAEQQKGCCDGIASSVPPTQSEGLSGSNNIEHYEYRNKLGSIQQWYLHELDKYESHCSNFKEGVVTLLTEQSAARPIAPSEVERTVRSIEHKFTDIQIQLKQQTCEAVMHLKSRFLDARRKRRNFSKQASEILNSYFYAHLHNPYPSEEAKEELARQCDITVSQVSNWFGNKRIRYKRNTNKIQEEAKLYTSQKAPVTAAAVPYDPGMLQMHQSAAPLAQIMMPGPSTMMSSQMIPNYSDMHLNDVGMYGGQSYAPSMGYASTMCYDSFNANCM